MNNVNRNSVEKGGRSRLFRRKASRGQTFLEFAIVAPLFFGLMFALFDFGRLFFVQMNLEQAVFEAGRYASTGNHLANPNSPGQNLSRVNSIISIAQQAADSLGATLSSINISSINGGAGSAGGPGDTVTVAVTASLPLMTPLVGQFFPGGAFTFTSSATFKNEPFNPSQTN
jgi:Flp pilus assembly protein TadG